MGREFNKAESLSRTICCMDVICLPESALLDEFYDIVKFLIFFNSFQRNKFYLKYNYPFCLININSCIHNLIINYRLTQIHERMYNLNLKSIEQELLSKL